MADCSKTEVFLAEWMRICDNNNACGFCPANGYLCKRCYMYDRSKLEEHKKTISTMIATVQSWSDDHPAPKPKTYADDFFEKHPKARKYVSGEPCVRACDVYSIICDHECFGVATHGHCSYWNELYKEEKE